VCVELQQKAIATRCSLSFDEIRVAFAFETLISQPRLSGQGVEKPLLEFADYYCTPIPLMELFARRPGRGEGRGRRRGTVVDEKVLGWSIERAKQGPSSRGMFGLSAVRPLRYICMYYIAQRSQLMLAGRWHGVRLSIQGIAQSKKRDEERDAEARPLKTESSRIFLLCRSGVAGGICDNSCLPTLHACPAWFQAPGQVRIGGKRGEHKTSMYHFHRSTNVGGQGPGSGSSC
jgi:hypothetical protein